MIWSYINKIYLCKQYFVVQFKPERSAWSNELVKSKVKSDLIVNSRGMRTEIDLNESEIDLKANRDRSKLIQVGSILVWIVSDAWRFAWRKGKILQGKLSPMLYIIFNHFQGLSLDVEEEEVLICSSSSRAPSNPFEISMCMSGPRKLAWLLEFRYELNLKK